MVGLNVKKPDVNRDNSDSRMRRTDHPRSVNSSVDRILFLQRTVGNQAVQRLLRSGTLQAKLRIGQPGDVYEQEADRVADEVMRMPEPEVQRQVGLKGGEEETLQTKPLINEITPLVQIHRQEKTEEEVETIQAKPLTEEITPLVQRQAEPEEEEEEMLQAKEHSDLTSEISPNLEARINTIRGSGQPLSKSEVTFFEPRFGCDFNQVRLHTDTQADDAAKVMNARAFTLGNDIVFGAGQYAPQTTDGRYLMAHELTHVKQHTNDKHTINFWGGDDHKEITNKTAIEIIGDGMFAYKLGITSTLMDYKTNRLLWSGPAFLLGINKGEGPDHGEDGNYSNTNESTAAGQNKSKQNSYLNKALQHSQEFNLLKRNGEPVHKLGSVANKMFDDLGDACHIAQDRGSHREGVKGRGHDDPRTENDWDPDNKEDNSIGYQKAVDNTRQLLEEWKSRRIVE